MTPDDAHQLALQIRTPVYGDWVLFERILHVSCYECGGSTTVLFRRQDAFDEVRLMEEHDLTHAVREVQEDMFPLYREVIELREQNANMKRRIEELEAQPRKPPLEFTPQDLYNTGLGYPTVKGY